MFQGEGKWLYLQFRSSESRITDSSGGEWVITNHINIILQNRPTRCR